MSTGKFFRGFRFVYKHLDTRRYATSEQKTFECAERDFGGASEIAFSEKQGDGFESDLRVGKEFLDDFEAAAKQVATDDRQRDTCGHAAQCADEDAQWALPWVESRCQPMGDDRTECYACADERTFQSAGQSFGVLTEKRFEYVYAKKVGTGADQRAAGRSAGDSPPPRRPQAKLTGGGACRN